LALVIDKLEFHGLRPLHGRTHNHVTVLRTRNGTLDQQQLAGFVDADDFEILRGGCNVAHMTGHALTRENATRILCHTNRTRHVMRTAITVRSALRAEVVTLDGAGEALTDGGTTHIHLLTDGKNRHSNYIARLEASKLILCNV